MNNIHTHGIDQRSFLWKRQLQMHRIKHDNVSQIVNSGDLERYDTDFKTAAYDKEGNVVFERNDLSR